VSSANAILGRVIREYAWEHRLSFLGGAIFLLLTNALTVAIPIEIGAAVDALKAGAPVSPHALEIAGMGAAIIVVRALSRVLFFNPGRDIEYQLRRDLFARLMRLQPSFYAGRKTGDIVSRASNDITVARAVIGFGSLQVVNTTLAIALCGWKMVQISPILTAAALVPVLSGVALVQAGISRMFALQRRNQEELGAIGDHVLGSFQGIATIQGFVAEDAMSARFLERCRAWFDTGLKLALVRSFFMPLLGLAGGLGVYLILRLGSASVLSGALSVGQLAAFMALLGTLVPPLRGLGFLLSVVQRGAASLARIFELLDAPVERPEGASGHRLPPGRGPAIRLEGLSFAFPDAPERQVLRDLRAEIPAGAVVGLFGRTGSGRSTLIKVLSRLYNPPPGTVFVDGVDLRDLDLDAWRARLAVVPQRPFLFSDSIAANVALDDHPDPARIAEVVELAALTQDLAALPKGIDTVVGERGVMLSGGQRQRVALARGLYRRPDVVLLDDVLSAVDHDTERRLVDALRRVSHGEHPPTTFIASHRLSALRHADLILVFEDGRIVDQGVHQELIGRPGVYRDAWELQREDAPGAAAEAS